MARKKATSPSPAEQDLTEQSVNRLEADGVTQSVDRSSTDASELQQTEPMSPEDGFPIDESPPNTEEDTAGNPAADETETVDAPEHSDAVVSEDTVDDPVSEDSILPDGEPLHTDDVPVSGAMEGFGPEDEAGDYEMLLRDLGQMPHESIDLHDGSPLLLDPDSSEDSDPSDAEEESQNESVDELLLMPEDMLPSDTEEIPEESPAPIPDTEPESEAEPEPAPKVRSRRKRSAATAESEEVPSPAADAMSEPSAPRRRITDPRRDRVLSIDPREEILTPEDQEAIIWHEIQNSHWTHRILTGVLYGVETTPSGFTVALVNYKGIRVAIPLKDMMLYSGKIPSGREYVEMLDHMSRILSTRMNSEVDFVVQGHDNKERSVIGSRKEAMYRKRKTFYMDTNELGEHLIYEGRVVQARVIAVADKVIRVEIFGVECPILARDLSWEWIGSAREEYEVGDKILVRVQKIYRPDIDHIRVRADVRSVSNTSSREKLRQCYPQCRYVGRVTDVRNGVAYIRLINGVNAIAHTCYDMRYPGKKDDVSFAVTRIDEERDIAYGIITRIIKQNL